MPQNGSKMPEYRMKRQFWRFFARFGLYLLHFSPLFSTYRSKSPSLRHKEASLSHESPIFPPRAKEPCSQGEWHSHRLKGCMGSMRKGVIARSCQRRSNLFFGQRLLRCARNVSMLRLFRQPLRVAPQEFLPAGHGHATPGTVQGSHNRPRRREVVQHARQRCTR